jgi:hypothetical protein
MLRGSLTLLLLVVACTPPAVSSDAVTGTPSSKPERSSEPSCLSGRRLDFLTDQFFVRYNARDLDAFLGLFHFSVPAAGGGFGSYYDNSGEPRTMRDRASLSDYIRERWTVDDRFVSWSVGGMPDGLNYPNASPTVSFTRSFGGEMQAGNVKLVCNAGLLVGVVMSSSRP